MVSGYRNKAYMYFMQSFTTISKSNRHQLIILQILRTTLPRRDMLSESVQR